MSSVSDRDRRSLSSHVRNRVRRCEGGPCGPGAPAGAPRGRCVGQALALPGQCQQLRERRHILVTLARSI
jgi:hypothetical protein